MQSITCLTTDVCLTADPGVTGLVPARSHTFGKIDHEIISMVILLPSRRVVVSQACPLKECSEVNWPS